MDALFELPDLEQVRRTTHACTGPGCHFCEWLSGQQARDRAVTVIRMDPAWLEAATVWRRDHIGADITADDLVEAVGLPEGSPNQIGALFRKWAQMGLCRVVDYKKSQRNSNHARRILVWEVTA